MTEPEDPTLPEDADETAAEAPEGAVTEAPEEAATEAAEEAATESVAARPTWWRRALARIPVPRPQSRLGAVWLILATLAVGVAATIGGVHVVEYSESTAFCTLCHTMIPQQKAHEASVHSTVECGSCHVAPGVVGFVSAKLAGTRELYALITNTYPTPIPAIDHRAMPSTEVTCQKCHPLTEIDKAGGPTKLVLRTTFASDETNTRKDIAVLLRPANAGTAVAKSIHWHVEQKVTYTSSDEHLQSIDAVEFTDSKTGLVEDYIAVSQVHESNNAGADIARLKATQQVRTMDCMDCHNRVGHSVPPADKAIDQAMATGAINPSLPYVKRNVMALVTRPYASSEAGTAAINGLGSFYNQSHPLVADAKGAQIAQASKEIAKIYDLIVTPQMKTGDLTYADNLGHQSSPGCFRCHDGAHYKVVEGHVTKEPIPSTCDTCHTFPQIAGGNFVNQGNTTAGMSTGVPTGQRPADHVDTQWVFNHRNVAGTATPDPATCGACHTPSYCETCHSSGAVKVDHYTMLYNHAQSVRDAGGTLACAVCHQPAYCAQCHKDDTLGPSNSRLDKPGG